MMRLRGQSATPTSPSEGFAACFPSPMHGRTGNQSRVAARHRPTVCWSLYHGDESNICNFGKGGGNFSPMP